MLTKQRVLAANPLCFWDFAAGLTSHGRVQYTLGDAYGNIPFAQDGLFGNQCPQMAEGRYFTIPRAECPKLNFGGEQSGLTVVAWVKREAKAQQECQAVAGMWNETRKERQYCLFLDLRIWDSAQQVGGHVSATGGPTEGFPYCMDAAIGATPVPMQSWHMIAFTYNGTAAKTYLNGALDARDMRNPYVYERPLFAPQTGGADFTVGGVHRGGEMGNWFTGSLGGLAIFDRPLDEAELGMLAIDQGGMVK